MSRLLFTLSMILLLSACSKGADEAKQLLEDSLPYSRGLELSKVEEFPGGVVCGEYGAYVDERKTRVDGKPFITVRGKLNRRPTPMDLEIFCSDTPAAALLNGSGVGPFDADNSELAQVTADMSLLADALETHYRKQFIYPRGEQGLEALVAAPADPQQAVKAERISYLESIPVDPWGRPYLYREDQWGRTKGSFTITTLGADGQAGGSAENADVSSTLLPYLQHVAAVLAGE